MSIKKLKKGLLARAHKQQLRHSSSTDFQKLIELSIRYAKEGDFKKEEDCYRKLLKISPDDSDVLNHLGNALGSQYRLSEALACYEQALIRNPKDIGTHANIGDKLVRVGRVDEAILHYKKFLTSSTNEYILYSSYLFALNYLPTKPEDFFYAEAKKWWEIFGNHFFGRRFSHNQRQKNTGRIRIGYVSPDFRRHSVSYFFLPTIKNHDRTLFHVYCYSDVATPDDITEEIKAHAETWRPVFTVPDEDLMQKIYEDRIDILIDLAGHTGHNRLPVFARKPAPIQVSWLGYPNTTGLESIDYRFTDDIADPPGTSDDNHTETLVRLPHGFLCYSPPQSPPTEKKNRADSNTISFGSFNNLSKINEETVTLWSEILAKVPNSLLIMKANALRDNQTRVRYKDMFRQKGISEERIKMRPSTSTTEEHLGMYREIDIALDTHPYNGTTTTCEALWMDTPVITLYGNRHASRVGGSILSRIGYNELICHSKEQYVAKAVQLATEARQTLEYYRNTRERMIQSELCNPKQFCQQLESAYKKMLDTIH